MSDFGFLSGFNPEIARAAASAAFRPVTTKTVAVDVAAPPTKAEISRGGFAVAEIAVANDRVASFLDNLSVVRTKVVTQTIAAGTAVARGTAIDVVLAQTGSLPVNVIPGAHVAFNDLTMAQLHDRFVAVPEVRDLVRTRTTASQLTASELTTLAQALEQQDVPVSTTAGQTVESAFTAIQAAFTFQA